MRKIFLILIILTISFSEPNIDQAAYAIPVSNELINSSLSIDFSKATASAILNNSNLSARLFNIFFFAPKKNGLMPILITQPVSYTHLRAHET